MQMLKRYSYIMALLVGLTFIVWLAIYWQHRVTLLEPFKRTWLPKRFQQIALKIRK